MNLAGLLKYLKNPSSYKNESDSSLLTSKSPLYLTSKKLYSKLYIAADESDVTDARHTAVASTSSSLLLQEKLNAHLNDVMRLDNIKGNTYVVKMINKEMRVSATGNRNNLYNTMLSVTLTSIEA